MMIDAFLPLPARGERVGVRGWQSHDRGLGELHEPLTLPSRYARRAPPSPRMRGEGTMRGYAP
jgi:hypothetical protein